MNICATITYPHIDPVFFRLGPLEVKWYGLAYLVGFGLAYLILRSLVRRGTLRMSVEQLSDFMVWLVVGVVVGGRLGWWLFYHRGGGNEPWYEPVAIWHGGMSFHGGLVGVIFTMLVWAKLNRVAFWNLADCAALVTPIGLCLGRVANFINAELVGRPTNVPWGIVLPGDELPRHPSQFYEAVLEGPLLLLALWAIHRRRPRDGTIALWFVVLYSAFRFLVEFTREPDSQLGFVALGWLTMGQLLSVTLILLVAVFLWTRLCSAPTAAG